MNLADLDFLTSDTGAALLEQLAHDDLSDAHTMALLTRLRKDFSLEQASAALTLARLRRKAEAKFGAEASRMYFTTEALEQASDPRISRYRGGGLADGLLCHCQR